MGKNTADDLVEVISKQKSKKKGEQNMKKTIILTVLSTVAVISLFVATFVAGVNYQKRSDANVNAKIEAAVKSVETSKN